MAQPPLTIVRSRPLPSSAAPAPPEPAGPLTIVRSRPLPSGSMGRDASAARPPAPGAGDLRLPDVHRVTPARPSFSPFLPARRTGSLADLAASPTAPPAERTDEAIAADAPHFRSGVEATLPKADGTALARRMGLAPEFADSVQTILDTMAEAGYPMTVVSGKRSTAHQMALYAQGRIPGTGSVVTELDGVTKKSRHQLGDAADLAFVGPDGKPMYEGPWDVFSLVAKNAGLEWGGDWKSLVDKPHIQAASKPATVTPPLGSQAPANAEPRADFRVDVVGDANAPRRQSFLDALGGGIDQAQAMLYGGVEAAAELAGLDTLRQWAEGGRTRNEAEQAAYGTRAEFTNIRGLGDFGQWVKETVGNQIPIMAPSIAGAATGAAIGSVVPGVGTTIGGLIGAFAPSFAMGVGEVQAGIKERGGTAPGFAFVGGAAIAALDSALPGKVGSKLVSWVGREAAEQIAARALTKPVTDSMIKRSLKGTVEGLFTEGLTEALQEAIGETATAYGTNTPFDPNLPLRMVEVGAAGALMGGMAGAVPARDVAREGVGSKAAQDITEAAKARALSGASADAQDQNRRQEPPAAPPSAAAAPTPPPTTPPVGPVSSETAGSPAAAGPTLADLGRSPAAAYLPPEFTAVGEEPTVPEPAGTAGTAASPIPDPLARIPDKLKNGQALGTPEARAAFEQRGRYTEAAQVVRDEPDPARNDTPADIAPGQPAAKDDIFAKTAARIKERERISADLGAAGNPVVLRHSSGRTALASEDPSVPGQFRWTRFDENGEPTGHSEAQSLQQAVYEAMQEGYEPDIAPARRSVNPAPSPVPGQPKVRVTDLSGAGAIGAYQPLSGDVMLDREALRGLSREKRAELVRHELAHKIETEAELWQQSDTVLWELWERDKKHPIFDYMGERTGRSRFGNDVSPEIIAHLYATDYPSGTFTIEERPYPYPEEGDNPSLTYPIPPALMEVLDQIEDRLGIWGKRAARSQARTPEAVARPASAPPVRRPKVELDTRDKSVDASPAVSAGRLTRDQAFMLRWLVDDIDQMRGEAGGVMRGKAAIETLGEATSQEEGRRALFRPATGGSPVIEMFKELGVSGSASEIANQIEQYLMGDRTKATKAIETALRVAPVLQAAWDGNRFDYSRVPEQTWEDAKLHSSQMRGPASAPRPGQPDDLMRRFFGIADRAFSPERKGQIQRRVQQAKLRREMRDMQREVAEREGSTDFNPEDLEAPAAKPKPTLTSVPDPMADVEDDDTDPAYSDPTHPDNIPVADARPYLTARGPNGEPAYAPVQNGVWTGGQRDSSLAGWIATLEAMGYDRADLDRARFDAEIRGVDVTRSDDLQTLSDYLDGLDEQREEEGEPVAPHWDDEDSGFDTLETGERQGRLPGDVGAVRDEERETPHEDLPQQTLTLDGGIIPDALREPEPSLLDADDAAAAKIAAKLAAEAEAAQTKPETQPVAFTTENLQTVFGLSNEQAVGVVALADAMGLDISKIAIAKGGQPGASLLYDGEPLFQSGPRIELLDADESDVNASGESAASREALNRVRAMRAAGETFAVRKRGTIRPLIGPDAVDYRPQPFEEFGIQGKDGSFRVLSRGEQKLYQAAWHGSPHIFDQFSLQKIGTGEGAQAYGWGLYFAGDKAVAEFYRDILTKQKRGNPKLDPDFVASRKAGLVDLGWRASHVDRLVEVLRELDGDVPTALDGLTASQRYRGNLVDGGAANILRSFAPSYTYAVTGRLYKVEIPEDDDFLDYGKPLSQQPEKVQAAIRRIGLRTDDGLWYAHQLTAADVASGNFTTGQVGDWVARVDDSAGNLIGWGGRTWGTEAGAAENAKSRNGIGKASDPRGSTLYNRIPGDTAREKSERLAAEGVAGIRYLDGASRRKGAGNYNYVVFDDKLIKIMEFEQGAKASVEFMEGGKALIRALQNPDVSSPAHELAHIARRWLLNRDVPAEHRRGISDEDIATAEQWAGATDGKWDRDAEEKFARGFERYLRDGGPALPTKIRDLFTKFAAWLTDIYRSLQGSEVDIDITPAMREVFDRLVTRAERNEQPAPNRWGGQVDERAARIAALELQIAETSRQLANDSGERLGDGWAPAMAQKLKDLRAELEQVTREGRVKVDADHAASRVPVLVKQLQGRRYRVPPPSVDTVSAWFKELAGHIADLNDQGQLTDEQLSQALSVWDRGELDKQIEKWGRSPLPAVKTDTKGVTVRATDRGSVEIQFATRPSAEMLDKVRAAGYRWAKSNKVWYKKGATVESARALVGLPQVGSGPAARSLQSPATQTFKVGDRVTADEGTGTLHAVQDDNVKIALEPDGRLSKWIPVSRVRVAPAEAPKPKKIGPPSQWEEIGKNDAGQTIYENEKGVRSYIENGVRHAEAIGFVPGQGGVTKRTSDGFPEDSTYRLVSVHPSVNLMERDDLAREVGASKKGQTASTETYGHAAVMSPGAEMNWWENVIEEHGPVRGRAKSHGPGVIVRVDAGGFTRVLQFQPDNRKNAGKDGYVRLGSGQVEPAWRDGQLVPERKPTDPNAGFRFGGFINNPDNPAPSATDAKRAALAAKRAALKDEIAAEFARLRAGLRDSGNTLSSGLPVPPVALITQTVKIVRLYARAGIVDAQDGWLAFQEDFGAGFEQLRRAFELAWDEVFGVEGTRVAADDEKAQTQDQEAPRAQGSDQETLEDAPTADDGRDDARSPRSAGARDSGDGRGRGDDRDSEGAESRPGARTGGGRLDAPRVGELGRDFVITDEVGVGEVGGDIGRVQANLDAIRTLKAIERENRPATPEEQVTLARYVGWGAVPGVFEPYHKLGQRFNAEIRDLLTDEEYRTAAASTPNAHYTAIPVVRAIWRAVERLGVDQGRVLEPSMGVGNFFGAMPGPLRAATMRSGVELDQITGRIAKLLYPETRVQVTGFESARLPDGYFDLVISNVPFGDYPVHDPKFKGRPKALSGSIHNYFFAKALDKVRPGGLVAFVTSHHTMDAVDSTVRKYLASKADLLGMIRLPDNAFKGNAGTEVVTDVIFLRRRPDGQAPAGESFIELGDTGIEDPTAYTYYGTKRPTHKANEYFIAHPEMVVGRHDNTGKLYGRGGALNVRLQPGDDFTTLLDLAIAALPEGAITYEAPPSTQEEATRNSIPAPDHVKPFAWTEQDGKLWVREGDQLVEADVPEETGKRIRGMIGIRSAVRSTMRAMLDPDSTDAAIAAEQKALNKVYDAFVKRFGYLSTRANISAFDLDPDRPLLLSLEKWEDDDTPPTKAAIFSKRTLQPKRDVTKADTPQAALLASLNNKGRVDLAFMAQLTGQSESDLVSSLTGLIFKTPDDTYVTADAYLSGNVRQKLAQAEELAAVDPSWEPNVEALKAVQPVDLTPADISVRLGAPWVPTEYYAEFLAHLADTWKNSWQVFYVPATATWKVKPRSRGATDTAGNTVRWGAPRWAAHELVEAAMNMRQPVVYDRTEDDKQVVNQELTTQARDKLELIKEEWAKWLWQDDERAQALVDTYNRDYNNLRLRAFDGSHLKLDGMSADITLRPHQKNAIWRALQTRATGLGHVVGAGKTFAMIGAALEMRRLGLAKKPMFAVPNHLVEYWGAEVIRMYPAANVLIATKDDFDGDKRRTLMARIATGDWDAVIVAHSSFGLVPVSDDLFNRFLQQQIDELVESIEQARAEEGKKGFTVKELEKAKKRLEAKLRDARDADKQDNTVTFEELGVDALFVDEAHLFKNLEFATKMTRIAGLPAAKADRAFDMYLKTRYIAEGGGRLVFATGTPISNTMAEMYTQQRYLQPDALAAQGLAHFDAWAQQFGTVVASLELAAEGTGFRTRSRFAKFTNLPELINQFRQSWDILTAQDVKLPTPKLKGGKPEVVSVPATPGLTRFMEELVERAAAIRGEGGRKKPDPSEDNMLKVTGDGKKAALDMRLVGRGAPMELSPKLKAAVERIADIYKANNARKGTQLVFSDLGVPADRQAKGRAALPKNATLTPVASAEAGVEAVDAVNPKGKRVRWYKMDGRWFTEKQYKNRLLYVDRINVYEELRKALVKKGVPKERIAFIHEFKTDAAKEDLYAKVNRGDIRVLIGSTEKMGAGMNVQKKLVALHHLDVPWRPSDIEQREGRIIRQGNEFYQADPDGFEIEVLRYVTEGSFDAYSWQTVESKARFIAQAMRGDTTTREADDLEGGALTYAEVKAIATGNPAIMEKVKVDAELRKLQHLKAAHEREQWQLRQQMGTLPATIEAGRQALAAAQKYIDTRQVPDEFSMVVGGKTFTERDDASAAIEKAMRETPFSRERQKIGTYAGLDIYLEMAGAMGLPYPPHMRRLRVGLDGDGMSVGTNSAQGIEYAAKRRPEEIVLETERRLKESEKKLADMAALADQPFDRADRLTQLEAEQKRLDALLNLDAKGQAQEGTGPVLDGPDDEDTDGDSAEADDSAPPTRESDRGGPPRARRAPSGNASSEASAVEPIAPTPGRTAKINRRNLAQTETIETTRAIELPELVELAEMLQADVQVVKRFRSDKVGDFGSNGLDGGKIRLRADLFKKENVLALARTLAHEIGHLIDWLPTKTLKRGNLLGRLQSVSNFLKQSFSTPDGRITLAEVRTELLELSKLWRGPWTEDGGSYDKYRRSAKELYADALSALLNNPGLVDQKARTFYKLFFEYLNQKPEVMDAYRQLQELLSGTREELVARREARVDAMLGRADAKAIDVQRRKVAEWLEADKHYWMRFRQQHIDRNAPLLDRIKALEKRGVHIPQDEDPRYFLEERNYMGGKQKAFLERYIQPIYQSLQDAGIAWDEFGKALFYERIIADPKRSQIANPLGLSPESAAELYATLQKRLSAEQMKMLERAVIAFRLAAREIAEDAYDAGLYRDEMYAEMKENPAYVAFRVIDYMEKDMTSAVHHQIGTVKGIQNPADATILKMLVTMRAAEHNRVKVKAFDLLHQYFPDDITQAPGEWNGKGIVPRPPDDPKRQVLVPYKEKGRTKGKYVDPYIAASLNNESVGQNNAAVAILRWMNGKVFRPAFTGLNLGFQTFNFSRDFWRFWKNTPTMTLGRAMRRYAQGYRMAKVRAYGLQENASAADQAAYRDLIDAEGASILSLTFNDMLSGRDVADTQIEETFAQHGLGGPPPSQNRIRKVIEWVKNTGDFIETLPKAAAIYEFRGEGAISDISAEDRSFIRRKVGSPDFLMRGTYHPITNEVFLFSNAIIQAWRADLEVATDPKTASGFWWKTVAVNVAPKLAIAALLASSIGDDDDDWEWVKWLRGAFENMSEYDLTNYLPIPIPGYSDDQGNTLYMRMPQDDSGRLIGGLTWKALKIARDIGDQETWKTVGQVFDYMAGQAPGLTPSIQAGSDVLQFASGRNVYDPFRNRFLFTEDEVKAGGWDAVTKFLGYEFQQLGGSIFVKFHAGDDRPEVKTPGQQLLEFPLVSTVAGRWFKISQQGQRERLRAAQAVAATADARIRQAERRAVNEAVRTFMAQPGPLRTPYAAQRLAAELAKNLYPDAPARERQAQARDLAKRIRMGAARGQADPVADAVLGARSTSEKIAIINEHFAGKPAAREAWVRQAVREKILSVDAARAVLRAK